MKQLFGWLFSRNSLSLRFVLAFVTYCTAALVRTSEVDNWWWWTLETNCFSVVLELLQNVCNSKLLEAKIFAVFLRRKSAIGIWLLRFSEEFHYRHSRFCRISAIDIWLLRFSEDIHYRHSPFCRISAIDILACAIFGGYSLSTFPILQNSRYRHSGLRDFRRIFTIDISDFTE